GRELIEDIPSVVEEDVRDWTRLCERLKALGEREKSRLATPNPRAGEPTAPVTTQQETAGGPGEELKKAGDSLLASLDDPQPTDPQKAKILGAVNGLLDQKGFFEQAEIGGNTLPEGLKSLVSRDPSTRSASESRILNHWLLGEILTKDALVPAWTRSEA